MNQSVESEYQSPSMGLALVPIIILITMLTASVYFFGEDSSYGPNQIALLFTAGIAILIGIKHGLPWHKIESGITHSISVAVQPILILLAVGALIGTWIMAGIVPTMIFYGLETLSPSLFYASACILCAIISVVTGSSWTTAGTIGVALIGIGTALGMSLPITAGAIISGAYFGDKLSPLSETTNLAPAVAGTDLFSHIRHMLWTTVPSIIIAIALFIFIGFTQTAAQSVDTEAFQQALTKQFNIAWYLFIPPVIVIYMIAKKVPAFPAISIGALVGGIFAILFQPDVVIKFINQPEISTTQALIKGFWISLADGYQSSTGNAAIDNLLSRGGMSSMLNTIWLILSAMFFGGAIEITKVLQTITHGLLKLTNSTRSLIISTLATCIGTNLVTSDQYISIVLPGRMYHLEFEKRGLDNKNLSRCLEDGGTCTSALVPWNTCGAYMAANLGVATLAYLPFCFFNLLSPIISAIYGLTGFTIVKAENATSSANEPLTTA